MTTFRTFDWNRATLAFSSIFEDFHRYIAADWLVTKVGTTPTDVVSPGAAHGILVCTNTGADNDADKFQYAGGVAVVKEQFKFTPGKKMQFVCRFALSRVDGDFFAGLYITDTDPEGGLSDGIYFRKLAAEAGLKIVAEKDSVETTAVVITTLVAATYYEVEFYYDGGAAYGGDDKIKVFVNGRGAGSIAVTTAPDDEELALSFAIQNGSANVSTLSMDYIGARQER